LVLRAVEEEYLNYNYTSESTPPNPSVPMASSTLRKASSLACYLVMPVYNSRYGNWAVVRSTSWR
jgi:hypothetical protein